MSNWRQEEVNNNSPAVLSACSIFNGDRRVLTIIVLSYSISFIYFIWLYVFVPVSSLAQPITMELYNRRGR